MVLIASHLNAEVWWWQCSDRYIISLSPPPPYPLPSPFSPSLISRTVSVDVKHHVYLLTLLHPPPLCSSHCNGWWGGGAPPPPPPRHTYENLQLQCSAAAAHIRCMHCHCHSCRSEQRGIKKKRTNKDNPNSGCRLASVCCTCYSVKFPGVGLAVAFSLELAFSAELRSRGFVSPVADMKTKTWNQNWKYFVRFVGSFYTVSIMI